MRKLLLTRGTPGCGKSTTISEVGLSDYCLSSDQVRLLLSNPVLSSSGKTMISMDHEQRVWGLMRSLIDERTARGELIVVDATNTREKSVRELLHIANRRLYDVACIDFATMPVDLALERNRGRVEHRRVPDHVVGKLHEEIQSWRLPRSIKVLPWDEHGIHLRSLSQWLTENRLDYSDYSVVLHIGDIQGCHTPLLGPGGLLEDGLRDDVRYVFVGDLLDRGPNNGKVMRWFLDEALPRQNVDILWGNHEDHLVRWAHGEEVGSDEFKERTLPQLEAAGIGPRDLLPLCRRLREGLFYEWRGQKVMVTHAGLSTVPENPVFVPGRQYSHGTGYWQDPVDAQFDRNAPEGWVQVHGHRNHGGVGIVASARSFNLEDSVERGGHLRALRLDAAGFTPIAIRNRDFLPFRERRHMRNTIIPAWMNRADDGGLKMPKHELERMLEHRVDGRAAVRAKSSQRFPHVASLSFDRKIFYKGTWDEISVKARGMFINTNTLEVVARSYDKFFNVNEREETTPEVLERDLTFPVIAYLKENGFLGILGYDAETDDLFFASKSTPDGPFAQWFEEIARAQLSEGNLEALRRFLRDTESSMAFEVIDPLRDPHIIAYEQPKVVLLDVFRRSSNTEKLPFDELQRVATRYSLECKEQAITFRNWKQLSGFLRASADPDYTFRGQHVEGFVLEDAVGFQTKVKLFHYTFWKAMRSVKDRVMKLKEREGDLDTIQPILDGGFKERIWSRPEAVAFLEWAKEQDAEDLKADILTLKQRFEQRATIEPACPTL